MKQQTAPDHHAALRREVVTAVEKSLLPRLHTLRPRHVVDMMTMSAAELGQVFRRALRDELYERRRSAGTQK
ncbi:hypothetical protein JG536_28135 (plasmid) [Burkholderia ambifaria]|uniref:hypothetical protein n=1 Tax=Burkholderia ambifaria TaxID=152480 RepID=UPI00158A59F6|nr:hypothetical protein [Burkholderia ambifaria]QQJ96419.1 hypothetical protein JG536_12430 [Burkholderia ambifaria]QQK01068.1 hypothetical protein JG536_28135 [Burkholderia ambifaria]